MSDSPAPLLRVDALAVRYHATRDVLQDVSFTVEAGDTLGICGESGSGKSTLVRSLLGLLPAGRGEIRWHGRAMARFGRADWARLRRGAQPVFQDPLASLDPRMRIAAILAEPLEVHRRDLDRAAREARAAAQLERVGLDAGVLGRYPHELSGGQCQRVCIARAMIQQPEVLVCDEPVSALDVSIQAQIIGLLERLQRDAGTTLIFVSHNLAVIRRLCRRIIVMRQGRIVEEGRATEVLAAPRHEYTKELVAAVPALPRRGYGVSTSSTHSPAGPTTIPARRPS
ncbi:MAG: Oligopeptide transport ATP-binding protein OppF [Steroidobacteraceae bacterium]|nr:Oligopeptide transport ATP-binding protein OppF [Steroidobacteraceae bacterium]